jgi:N-acetyl-anhydromuramyl-L-alanine amidase AmpD
MLILFILAVSALIVALVVGIDVGEQVWSEKKAQRDAYKAKQLEAIMTLRNKLAERFAHILEVEVVELPKKRVGAKHRLVV